MLTEEQVKYMEKLIRSILKEIPAALLIEELARRFGFRKREGKSGLTKEVIR